LILGLTGGYCAGKNAVADILSVRGFACIDVDKLGHEALVSALPRVRELLGPGAVSPDGGPDRKRIASMVFADPELLARYEAIVHPAMFALVDAALEAAVRNGARACLNAAILYRMPQAKRCDSIIEVRAPLAARLARARRRDGLALRPAMDRIRSQRGLLALREDFADRLLVAENRGNRADLERTVDRILSSSTFSRGNRYS